MRHIDIFPWSDSFNTGDEKIDSQHKQLVGLLNQIASDVAFHPEALTVETVLDELINYTKYHFDTEESHWMGLFPEHEEVISHKQSHQDFIERVDKLSLLKNSITPEQWIESALSFLARWLASHILQSDRHMSFMVKSVRLGMNLEDAKAYADEKIADTHQAINEAILSAYEHLTSNTLHLMREIRSGVTTLQMLRESEEKLQRALDYAKIGQWEFPYQGVRANWSPEMYQLFGLPVDCVPGPEVLCSIIKSKAYSDQFVNSMQEAFKTGHEHHVEYPIIRPVDGAERWIECRGKVVYQLDGRPEKIAGFVQDITERKQAEQEIESLAYYDPLTLLPNRRLLLDRLERSLAMSGRSSQYHALFFLDIDHFKKLNDSHGHDYGDMLLKEVAVCLSHSIRKGDTLARLGGDEFMIIAERLSNQLMQAASQADVIGRKIVTSTAKSYQLGDINFSASISVGVVLFNDNALSTSELMQQADIAMYQAKRDGRNRVRFFNPKMQEQITRRVTLESELRDAITQQQFVLYFQPQVTPVGHITGAEALIRWNHPARGIVAPGEFISLAEETGLIAPIGEWVLRQACAQLRLWQQQASTRQLTLSVNVSSQQFYGQEFVSIVKGLVAEYQISPSKLKLELTESHLLRDAEQSIKQMSELNALGIQFSLDDFGTGYSSLQYLKKLPLYQLKIDRSFVRDLLEDTNDQAIIRTIISMAKSLGLGVIAEGVESALQKQHLLDEGCLLFQGYYFGKPLPIEHFSVLAARDKNAITEPISSEIR